MEVSIAISQSKILCAIQYNFYHIWRDAPLIKLDYFNGSQADLLLYFSGFLSLYSTPTTRILLDEAKILFFNSVSLYKYLQRFKHITFELINFNSHATYNVSVISFTFGYFSRTDFL